MDIYDSKKRSDIMRNIKSSGNASTEGKIIAFFRSHNIVGWRRKYKIYGKPDIVFCKQKIAIFLDGCFLHGHDCRNTIPKQNAEFWEKKRQCNILRDADVTEHLENLGWTVIRIWECELRKKNEPILLEKLKLLLENSYK